MIGKKDLTTNIVEASEVPTEIQAENRERIRSLRLIDDEFMTKVFEDRECTEYLIRTILDRNDLSVINVQTQARLKNLQGRDVILDIFAKDTTGRLYNIEVQRDTKGASLKRARYHGSLIDANILRKGSDFDSLPDRYIIFITETDVLDSQIQVNRLQIGSKDTDKFYDDGAYTIYVNASMTDDTPVGNLIQDMWQTEADMITSRILANRVKYFKEDERGEATMNVLIEETKQEARENGLAEGFNEGQKVGLAMGRKEGLSKGRKKEKNQIARSLLAEGLDPELISRTTGLTIDEINKLAN